MLGHMKTLTAAMVTAAQNTAYVFEAAVTCLFASIVQECNNTLTAKVIPPVNGPDDSRWQLLCTR